MNSLSKLHSSSKMLNLLKRVFSSKNTKCSISVYRGNDFSLVEIKKELSSFTGGSVELEMDNATGIGKVCINRPETKNAITGQNARKKVWEGFWLDKTYGPAYMDIYTHNLDMVLLGKMVVDLESVVSDLEQWETGKGVIIYGAKGNFCSGGDLQFAQKNSTPEGGYKMSKYMQNTLLRLQRLPIISVALIEGFALGGGAELAISCDYRLFAKDAAMGFVHSRMGIVPAWGGLTTAVQALGYRTALDLVATARVVRSEDAKSIGLCDQVVDDMAAAQMWLAERTRAEASVVRAAKLIAVNSKMADVTDQLFEFEKRVFAPLWGGPVQSLMLSQRKIGTTKTNNAET